MSVAAPLPQLILPPGVIAFAEENGVATYLPAVAEMTRAAFPDAPLTPHVEEDAELPDERYIVMEVDVTGWDEHRLFAAQQQWTTAIFQHCPATHVHFFVFGVWASA